MNSVERGWGSQDDESRFYKHTFTHRQVGGLDYGYTFCSRISYGLFARVQTILVQTCFGGFNQHAIGITTYCTWILHVGGL